MLKRKVQTSQTPLKQSARISWAEFTWGSTRWTQLALDPIVELGSSQGVGPGSEAGSGCFLAAGLGFPLLNSMVHHISRHEGCW